MKVLFLAARDSANFAGVKIIKELQRKGHEVVVYDKSLDEVNIRMFRQFGIEVNYFDEMTDDVVESCDIMFCHTTYMGDAKIKKKLYTFFFNYIYIYGHENRSDFVFTQCDDAYNTFPNKTVMKVGSPKFDRVHPEIFVPVEESKRILFIESGHYPFGEIGRTKVAKLILDICKKYPDYTITVKPRFLLTDTKKLTRRNVDHIYNYIYRLSDNILPENLELLNQHCDLEEMIYQSHSIICYYSSSYLEASLSGRGVIYVDEIETKDAIGDRQNKYWKAFNEYIQDTGIIVAYDKVLDYLPNGIKCSEKHLNKTLYSRENIAQKVVEVVEYVWENFLSKGIYPALGHYEYDTYLQKLEGDSSLTESQIVTNNKYDVLVYECQKKERAIGADVSFEEMYRMLEVWKNDGTIQREEWKRLKKAFKHELECYVADHAQELLDNKIDQAILFESYYSLGKCDKIEQIPKKQMLAEDAYDYFLGLHYCENNDSRGPNLIEKYFDFLRKTMFEESNIYFAEPLLKAFNAAFMYSARNRRTDLEMHLIDTMQELESKYKYDILNYDMRCSRLCKKNGFDDEVLMLVENWLHRDTSCIQLYRHLELDEEAYSDKAQIYQKRGAIKASKKYKEIANEKKQEKIRLLIRK